MADKHMDLNLYVSSLNASESEIFNTTVTDCLCTIYTTTSECSEETQTFVYGWFLILIMIILLISVSLYVTAKIQDMIFAMQDEREERRARRTLNFH